MTAELRTVPATAYHADEVGDRPTLSASIAHVLLTRSPLHAWHNHPKLNPNYQRTVEDKYDLGTVCHAALLEGSAEACTAVLNYDNWRTNDAKAERDEARAAGLIPMLAKDWDTVQAMYEAARRQLDSGKWDPVPFTGGKPEQCVVWDEDGVACRALVDWIHDGNAHCSDYKTTAASANPDKWDRTMFGIGGDLQAVFHSRGVEEVTGINPTFRFVVQETSAPYALSVVDLAPGILEIAEHKMDLALAVWKDCLERDEWPGYPARVATLELPAYEEAKWLEREAREAA